MQHNTLGSYRKIFSSDAPLHAMTTKGKSFCWGKPQHGPFEELRRKISNELVLAMPNLQQWFELETDARGHALGAVLMQEGRSVCYHSKLFHRAVLDNPHMIKNSSLLCKLWRSRNTINLYSSCKAKARCNKWGITIGWNFYNNSIYWSSTRKGLQKIFPTCFHNPRWRKLQLFVC